MPPGMLAVPPGSAHSMLLALSVAVTIRNSRHCPMSVPWGAKLPPGEYQSQAPQGGAPVTDDTWPSSLRKELSTPGSEETGPRMWPRDNRIGGTGQATALRLRWPESREAAGRSWLTSSSAPTHSQMEAFPPPTRPQPLHQVPRQSQSHDITIIFVTFGQNQYCPTANQTWLRARC